MLPEGLSLEDIISHMDNLGNDKVLFVAPLDDRDDYVNIFEIENTPGEFFPRVRILNALPVLRSTAVH